MNLNFFDGPVNIKEVKLGVVVQTTWFDNEGVKTPQPLGFGHIIGFGYNSTKEMIIKVKTPTGDQLFHPGNLIFNIE